MCTKAGSSNYRSRAVEKVAVLTKLCDPLAIVVLPFLNVSADPDQEYWSDGPTEELTSVLSRTGGLRVVSPTSAFALEFRTPGMSQRPLNHTHIAAIYGHRGAGVAAAVSSARAPLRMSIRE
jgi:TolB-like protein